MSGQETCLLHLACGCWPEWYSWVPVLYCWNPSISVFFHVLRQLSCTKVSSLARINNQFICEDADVSQSLVSWKLKEAETYTYTQSPLPWLPGLSYPSAQSWEMIWLTMRLLLRKGGAVVEGQVVCHWWRDTQCGDLMVRIRLFSRPADDNPELE